MNSEKRLPMSTWESFVNKKTKVRKSKEKDKCITNSNCFVKLKGKGRVRSLCHYNLLILNLSCSSVLCILSKIVVDYLYYCLLVCVLHIKPFISQKGLKSNFSQKYPYIIQQTGKENTPTYQVKVVVLIQHQILVTNLNGNT